MCSYNDPSELAKTHAGASPLVRGPVGMFVVGGVADVVTVFATQPFDTVKTRAQSARRAGTGQALDEGVRGLCVLFMSRLWRF